MTPLVVALNIALCFAGFAAPACSRPAATVVAPV